MQTQILPFTSPLREAAPELRAAVARITYDLDENDVFARIAQAVRRQVCERCGERAAEVDRVLKFKIEVGPNPGDCFVTPQDLTSACLLLNVDPRLPLYKTSNENAVIWAFREALFTQDVHTGTIHVINETPGNLGPDTEALEVRINLNPFI